MLEKFEQSKNELFNKAEELDYFIEEYDNQGLEKLLLEQKEKLKQSHFNLTVLGQFKRGKSTLINALINEELLPSGVLPLTAIITKLYYGEEKKAEVVFLNDEKKSY
nr:dynamin family protein [Halanaerobium hydrogeniformans]